MIMHAYVRAYMHTIMQHMCNTHTSIRKHVCVYSADIDIYIVQLPRIASLEQRI